MMILSFTLSMPNRSSWDGRWSGENNLYVIVKNFGQSIKNTTKVREILDGGYYRYNFSDGWAAAVTVKKVDAKEARTLRKQSCGFCGYDWMVESIISHGKILS